MIDKQIGNRIRKQRELFGYTREELAEKLEVSPKFCSDIEIGAKGMSVETLCKISRELALSTDYILFGKTHNEINDDILTLISMCDKEKNSYLKNIIINFIIKTIIQPILY